MKKLFCLLLFPCIVFISCTKSPGNVQPSVPPVATKFALTLASVDGSTNSNAAYTNVSIRPLIRLSFSEAVKRSSTAALLFNEISGAAIPYTITYGNRDSSLSIISTSALKSFTGYTLVLSAGLQSSTGNSLQNSVTLSLKTGLDSSDKFPLISDNELLDLVQRKTFNYFWDFGHPVSGLARERNTSGEVVTTGGSGFGIMAIVTAVSRQFITRADGLLRLQKITGFLKTKAQTFHGAFPHWLNGTTGAVVPFSAKDNGADLVETAYLMQGLLTARQYFTGSDAAETSLRADINALWNAVEWSWFRKGGENVLYWHWSPNFNWEMNFPVKGWNEALVTYVLAAASTTYPVPKAVYDAGWASGGGMKNGNTYYGYLLPLGPPSGGPLFFAHYSFSGINPTGLTDGYAAYWDQNKAHTLINLSYCIGNPKGFAGYSDACWGLTASDDNRSGYAAHEPGNDDGVISPTAALSSFPYTPAESMKALKFFYYKLGDKVWKEYGFVDAFNLTDGWFADSFLAIDQGPIVIMIENYRSNLLWNLFMSCPEIKGGMRTLGFQSPYL